MAYGRVIGLCGRRHKGQDVEDLLIDDLGRRRDLGGHGTGTPNDRAERRTGGDAQGEGGDNGRGGHCG